MADNHWDIVNQNRNVISSTALSLWENAVMYFNWSKDNPIKNKRTITSGKEVGRIVVTEDTRPLSVKALCLHCNISEEWLRSIRQTKDKESEYYIVVSKILAIIYTQNLEMATIGVFNPIFTAKVLGMEKDETPNSSIKISIVGGLPELSKSENEILEKLELENQKTENAKEENL